MATPVRFARPGTYMLTRRCSERRFFLKPSALINNLLIFLVAVGCKRYGLQLHAFCFMSNHYHLMVTDPIGRTIPKFLQWFNMEIGRATNCHLGRSGHFWDIGGPSEVWIPPYAEDLIEKLAYVICNPVTSQLVPLTRKWPGVVTRASDLCKKVFTAPRPTFFFGMSGNSPDGASIQTTLPRCVDATPEELEQRLRQRCNEVERQTQEAVAARGEHFAGAKRVLRTNRYDAPKSRDNWFGLDPHLACKDTALRIELLATLKAFREEYRRARAAFCAGDRDVVFPAGTYQMVERYGCATRPMAELDRFGYSYT